MSLTRAVLATGATLLLLNLAGCPSGSVKTDEIKEILKAKSDGQIGSIHNRFEGADARKKQLLEEAAKAHTDAEKAAAVEWEKNSQGTIQELQSTIQNYYQNVQKLRAHGPYLVLQVQYAGILRSIDALKAENVDYTAINTDAARKEIKKNNSEIESLAKETEPILKDLNERDGKIRYFSALIRVGLETLRKMSPGDYEVKNKTYETMLKQIEGFLASTPSVTGKHSPSQMPAERAKSKTNEDKASRLDELARKFRPIYEKK